MNRHGHCGLGNMGLCGLQLVPALFTYCFVFVCGIWGWGFYRAFDRLWAQFSSAPFTGHASSMYNWGKQLTQVVSTNVLTVLLSLNLTRYYLAAGNTGTPGGRDCCL